MKKSLVDILFLLTNFFFSLFLLIRAANAHTCHYIPGPKDIPNHSAHHLLKSLKDFQYLVEDFNGISYRGRIKNGTIVF